MRTFDMLFKSEKVISALEGVAIKICPFVVTNDTVCVGAVTEMGDILLPVLADSILSSDYMCAYFLELCDTPTYTKYFA